MLTKSRVLKQRGVNATGKDLNASFAVDEVGLLP